MLSLPIRSTSPETLSPHCYGDLSFDGESVANVLVQLSDGRLGAQDRVHNDPDLDAGAMPRLRGWKPILGQVGSAQTHLERNGVCPGDLFLFFGWFREIEKFNDCWQFCCSAPDIHVIFGWLQIERIAHPNAELAEELPWASYHPHFHGNWSTNNALYIATDRLILGGKKLATVGGGTYRDFKSARQLTAPGRTRSWWELPDVFFPDGDKTPLSYHSNMNRWHIENGRVLLKSAARGQEFVLDMKEYPGVKDWVEELFYDPGRKQE